MIKVITVLSLVLSLAQAKTPARARVLSAQKTPQISLQPGGRVLLGDPVNVLVTNLRPGQPIVLRAKTADARARRWQSSGFYHADAKGIVDTSKQPSVAGTYLGTDPFGLFWSMAMAPDTPEKERDPGHFMSGMSDNLKSSNVVAFAAEEEGKTLAEANLELVYVAPEVKVTSVRDNGIVANFYAPGGTAAGRKSPGIIIVGGSEGGMNGPNVMGKLLSSRGYAVLALAYFSMETLPQQLEEIPLEYFKKAIDWMRANPSVEAGRLAFIGSSKGGEAALLVGSTYPEIKAVVAYVPAHVSFQSIRFGGQPTVKSSWSFQGKPLPFVPYSTTTERPDGILALYVASLNDARAEEAAVIPVEKIAGPVLLISGRDDRLWPSSLMTERVVERLKKKRFRYPHRHLSYDGAGHSLTIPAQVPLAGPPPRFPLGGTERANAFARGDAFVQVVGFLEENLKR